MIKVLYITSTLRHCGPVNQLYNIISNLDRRLFQPVLLTLSPEPEDSLFGKFSEFLQIDSLQLNRIKAFFRAKRMLNKYIGEIQPDIIHSQGIRPDSLAVSVSDVPLVSAIRNDPFVDYPMKFGRLQGMIMANWHIKVIKRINYPVACSSNISEVFKKKYEIKLDFIQNGINTKDYFPVDRVDKKNVRAKLGIQHDEKILISVGSLIPRKDYVTLIKAFSKLKGFRLFIAGNGPEKEKLESLVNDQEITFTGHLNNIKEYLHVADYFVSSSISEGLPNTVLEAMACGLPVILSDIPSHREIFSGISYSGFFKTGSVADLSEKINFVANDDYSKNSSLVRELITLKFSADKMSKQYQDVYESVIK